MPVDIHYLAEEDGVGEAGAEGAEGVIAYIFSFGSIGEEATDGGGKGGGIGWGDEETVVAVGDDFGLCAVVGGDDGARLRHEFDDGESEGLAPYGGGEADVGASDFGVDVGHEAEPFDAVGHAFFFGEGLEGGDVFRLACAGYAEGEGEVVEEGEGLDEGLKSFLGGETAGEEEGASYC